MSQPQPEAGRPADGADGPAVTEPPTAVPTPAGAEATNPPSPPDAPETDASETRVPETDASETRVPETGVPRVAASDEALTDEAGEPVTAGATPQVLDPSDASTPSEASSASATSDASADNDAVGTSAVGTEAERDAQPTTDTSADATPAVPAVPAGRARGSAAVPGRATPPPPTRVENGRHPTRVESAPDAVRMETGPNATRIETGPNATRIETGPNATRVENGLDAARMETGPNATRVENGPPPTRVEPPAPRWSGSAAVPPPPPRRRGWGESAEPTPVPPVASPEHATPVDPWAGVDTTGWDLHSADLPALPAPPATMPYTAPWPAHPAPHPAPPPVSPPAPAPPYPGPPAARPVSPPAHTPPYPASPAARPVSPPAYTPPPAPVVAPRAPKQARPPKQRRGGTPPPVAPPPGWQAPKGYAPRRRRRRWPWVLLLSVACCCGVPLWWVQPLSSQYPASASLPDQLDSMQLRQDERSRAAAEELKSQVRQADLLAEDTFAGIYATDDGKRVTLFGSTGFRLTPESDAEAELKRLAGDYALQASVSVDTGVRGRYERCAVGRTDGDAVVVCTSVDYGSLTTGVFTRLSVDDSGRLLNELREQVVLPKKS
ncbi:hypothetical protein [Micromonospora sp. RP3T]|uniref:hypothetical protein n=1 Tax=Micromonospora sp. RP3T TaxID=2135446 RepID=UPI000D15B872|nr:hypothetical protein [Micromonospora sp. RP3T]PTA47007.1 hypothetical protein C8054_05690 [Micromonospora sp. RP3T]